MAHCNTILFQILKLVPRHEFETLANQHHSGRSFRTASRWSQFVTMAMAQLAGRISLRDIVENIGSQTHRLYHLGSAKLSRSNLSRINENKPYALYEALFGKLLNRCQGTTPGHDFNFQEPALFVGRIYYRSMPVRFSLGGLPNDQGRHQTPCRVES